MAQCGTHGLEEMATQGVLGQKQGAAEAEELITL